MSTKILADDLMSYSQAKGFKLTTTQARALAALNARKITSQPLTRGYWRQLNKIVNDYLRHQSTKDRVCGTFAA